MLVMFLFVCVREVGGFCLLLLVMVLMEMLVVCLLMLELVEMLMEQLMFLYVIVGVGVYGEVGCLFSWVMEQLMVLLDGGVYRAVLLLFVCFYLW